VFRGRIGTELPPDFAHMPDGNPYPSGTAYEVPDRERSAAQAWSSRMSIVFRSAASRRSCASTIPKRRTFRNSGNASRSSFDTWFVAETGPFKAAFHTFGSTDEFEAQLERLLRRWGRRQSVARGPLGAGPLAIKGSPFRGLAAFGVRHAPVFSSAARATSPARWIAGRTPPSVACHSYLWSAPAVRANPRWRAPD
jgi:hypothetical protein